MPFEWTRVAELAVTAGATLVAAYWGARAAFQFNQQHEAERERRAQVEECNRAMLILLRQYNQLVNFREQFLDPARHDQGRYITLPPSRQPDYSSWTVNVPSLSFLLQTGATELPFMLALADQRFHSAIAAMTARSELHSQFQSKLEQVSPERPKLTLEEMNQVMGERLAATLRQATEQLYELVDGAIEHHEKVGRDARLVLKTLYKGATIIGYGPDPNRPRNTARVGDDVAHGQGRTTAV